MDRNHDAALKLNLLPPDRYDLALESRRGLKEAPHIAENGLRLIHAARENERHALLAGGKPVLHEQREVDRHGGGHAGLAATAAGYGPQLADTGLGRRAVARDGVEGCQLCLGERPAKGRLEDHEPYAPRVGVAEAGT